MWGNIFGDPWPNRLSTFGNRFTGFGEFNGERSHPFWDSFVCFPHDKPGRVSDRKKARLAQNRSSGATNIPVRCEAREDPARNDKDVKEKEEANDSSKLKLSPSEDERAIKIEPSKNKDVLDESRNESFYDSNAGSGEENDKLTENSQKTDFSKQFSNEGSASQVSLSNSDSENVKESIPVRWRTQSAEEKKLNAIKSQLTRAKELVPRVEVFDGSRHEKEFLFLEEHLTRCILGLDLIDAGGLENVKSARKAAVKEILSIINDLETRVSDKELHVASY